MTMIVVHIRLKTNTNKIQTNKFMWFLKSSMSIEAADYI
jgi:hypothetical protein